MDETWFEIVSRVGAFTAVLTIFYKFFAFSTKPNTPIGTAVLRLLVLVGLAAVIGRMEFTPTRNCSEIGFQDGDVDRLRIAEQNCKSRNSDVEKEWGIAFLVLFGVAGGYGVWTGRRPTRLDDAWRVINETAKRVGKDPSFKGSPSEFEDAVRTLRTLPLSDEYLSGLHTLSTVVRLNNGGGLYPRDA